MNPGYVIVWQGQTMHGFLTRHGTWSPDACDAHVYATWGMAKAKSRAFKGANVVEAWV